MSDLAEADSTGSPGPALPQLLHDRSGVQRVTSIELFFDLVYVFAVTQLSRPPTRTSCPNRAGRRAPRRPG